jgi:hypothetical protein
MKTALVVITVAIGALLLTLPAMSALAQATPTRTPTPMPSITPTATFRPTQPTPTSAYQYLRITPTPLPPPNATPIAGFQLAGGTFADTAINMYRYVNNVFRVGDLVSFILVGLFVALLLMRTLRRLNSHDS